MRRAAEEALDELAAEQAREREWLQRAATPVIMHAQVQQHTPGGAPSG